MIGEDDMEHYNEEYGELEGTDVQNSNTSFYDSPSKEIQTKKSKVSNGKRPCFNEDSSISFSKKRKETTQDRLLKWNSFYSSEKFGILVQCIKCKKWRKVSEYEEEHQVPRDWCCAMNLSGPKDCNEPECLDEDDFNSSKFVPGSIVWAKLAGYPWWPAMVEDDPDTEEYYWEDEEGKKYYNVTFLDDKVTHAWVPEFSVLSFLKDPPKEHIKSYRIKYSHLIEKAREKANTAIAMTIKDRLKTFSFAKLYKGKWPLAKSFDNDEDNTELTKMLIKEVEEMDSIKFTDSENEMDSSIEVYNPVCKTNEIKESSMSDSKIMNLKHMKQKMNEFQPKNSNQKLGRSIIYKEDHLAPGKTEEKETIATSHNCNKKNNLIGKCTKETIPYKRKKNKNKSDHVLLKLDKNELLNSNSTKTGRNRIMSLGQSRVSKCPIRVTNKSEVRENKPNGKTELKIKKREENNKLSNTKKIKTFAKDDMVEKRILQNPPIKSESCKTTNSKKKLSFQPPVKIIANTTSKEKKESLKNNKCDRTDTTILGSIQYKQNEENVSKQDISDGVQPEIQEEKAEIENEEEIGENARICQKNEAENNIHKRENKSKKLTGVSQSLNNSDCEDIIILDTIPNNHREKSFTEQTEDFFEEEKSKPEQPEIENKQKIKQKVKIFRKETEVNIHNSKGKQKSHKLMRASFIQENAISEDNVFIENSDGSKTQDKLRAKELIISKETKKAKGEKSVHSNDQILKILEKNINDSVDSKCNLKSATDKNDTFSKFNPQNANAEFSGGVTNNNIEKKANIKTTRSEKNSSNLRQENYEKQKKFMKSSKPNASGINDKNAEPKQTSNKKYENKKLNKQFSNTTKSNICKQGNVAMPNGQCNAKVCKDIETSKKNNYLLYKNNNSEEKPRTNIPQGMHNKIQKKKISDKNHANMIEAEESLVTLNECDNGEQNNYSFSFEMNNEQNENEDSDPFEVD